MLADRHFHRIAVIVTASRHILVPLKLIRLSDVYQHAVLIHPAYAPGNTAILAQRIAQDKSAHTDVEHVRFRIHLIHHILVNLLKSLFAIVIIRIDNDKRFMNHLLRTQDRLAGSPWLRPVRRLLIAFREICKLLKCVLNRGNLLDTTPDDLLKILFQILPDNEHDLVKSGLQRVMNRIVHDDLTTGSYRFQLLDSTAKPASDTCRHNH